MSWWPVDGDEPDPRWSLANERTLLAYERTALGLIVAGFAIAGSHAVAETPVWVAAIGLPLVGLGGSVGMEGRRRFLHVQQAMRNGDPLTGPRVTSFLPLGIAAIALVGLVLSAVHLFA